MSATLIADPSAIVNVNPKDLKFNEDLFQKMPKLTDEAREALLTDIQNRGVTVPIEITTEGVVVDGHNRVMLAKEAGLDSIPAIVKSFDSDEAATAHVFAVNLQRRHLNQADKRKLVKEYLALDPYKSNRQIAEDLGGAVTDKTVGTIRDEAEKAGEVEATTERVGKDKKKRSTSSTGTKKKSPAAAERRKIEQERMATSAIRLGLEEAAKLVGRVEGFDVSTIMGVLSNATKAKSRLVDALTVVLPLYISLAAELGIEGYEYETVEAEADAEVKAEAKVPAAEGSEDAPF